MSDFFPVYVYFAVVLVVTLITLGATTLFASQKTSKTKFMPYESGIKTQTH